jgi:hypothetical protein
MHGNPICLLISYDILTYSLYSTMFLHPNTIRVIQYCKRFVCNPFKYTCTYFREDNLFISSFPISFRRKAWGNIAFILRDKKLKIRCTSVDLLINFQLQSPLFLLLYLFSNFTRRACLLYYLNIYSFLHDNFHPIYAIFDICKETT